MIDLLIFIAIVLVVWTLIGAAILEITLMVCEEEFLNLPVYVQTISMVLCGPFFWVKVAKVYWEIRKK